MKLGLTYMDYEGINFKGSSTSVGCSRLEVLVLAETTFEILYSNSTVQKKLGYSQRELSNL